MAQMQYGDMEPPRQAADHPGEGYGVLPDDHPTTLGPRSPPVPQWGEVHHERHDPFEGNTGLAFPQTSPPGNEPQSPFSGHGKLDLQQEEPTKPHIAAGGYEGEAMVKELEDKGAFPGTYAPERDSSHGTFSGKETQGESAAGEGIGDVPELKDDYADLSEGRNTLPDTDTHRRDESSGVGSEERSTPEELDGRSSEGRGIADVDPLKDERSNLSEDRGSTIPDEERTPKELPDQSAHAAGEGIVYVHSLKDDYINLSQDRNNLSGADPSEMDERFGATPEDRSSTIPDEERTPKDLQDQSAHAAGEGIVDVHSLKDDYINLSQDRSTDPSQMDERYGAAPVEKLPVKEPQFQSTAGEGTADASNLKDGHADLSGGLQEPSGYDRSAVYVKDEDIAQRSAEISSDDPEHRETGAPYFPTVDSEGPQSFEDVKHEGKAQLASKSGFPVDEPDQEEATEFHSPTTDSEKLATPEDLKHEDTAQLTSQIECPDDEPKQEEAAGIHFPVVDRSLSPQVPPQDDDDKFKESSQNDDRSFSASMQEETAPLSSPIHSPMDKLEQEQTPHSNQAIVDSQQTERMLPNEEDAKQVESEPYPESIAYDERNMVEGKGTGEYTQGDSLNVDSTDSEIVGPSSAGFASGHPPQDNSNRGPDAIQDVQEESSDTKQEEKPLSEEMMGLKDAEDIDRPESKVPDPTYVMGGRPERGIVVPADSDKAGEENGEEDDGRDVVRGDAPHHQDVLVHGKQEHGEPSDAEFATEAQLLHPDSRELEPEVESKDLNSDAASQGNLVKGGPSDANFENEAPLSHPISRELQSDVESRDLDGDLPEASQRNLVQEGVPEYKSTSSAPEETGGIGQTKSGMEEVDSTWAVTDNLFNIETKSDERTAMPETRQSEQALDVEKTDVPSTDACKSEVIDDVVPPQDGIKETDDVSPGEKLLGMSHGSADVRDGAGVEVGEEASNAIPIDKNLGDGSLLDKQSEVAEVPREATNPLSEGQRDISLDDEKPRYVGHGYSQAEDKADMEGDVSNAEEMKGTGEAEVERRDMGQVTDEQSALEPQMKYNTVDHADKNVEGKDDLRDENKKSLSVLGMNSADLSEDQDAKNEGSILDATTADAPEATGKEQTKLGAEDTGMNQAVRNGEFTEGKKGDEPTATMQEICQPEQVSNAEYSDVLATDRSKPEAVDLEDGTKEKDEKRDDDTLGDKSVDAAHESAEVTSTAAALDRNIGDSPLLDEQSDGAEERQKAAGTFDDHESRDSALFGEQSERAEERKEVAGPFDEDRKDVSGLDEQVKDLARGPPGADEMELKDMSRGTDEQSGSEAQTIEYSTRSLPEEQNIELKGDAGDGDKQSVFGAPVEDDSKASAPEEAIAKEHMKPSSEEAAVAAAVPVGILARGMKSDDLPTMQETDQAGQFTGVGHGNEPAIDSGKPEVAEEEAPQDGIKEVDESKYNAAFPEKSADVAHGSADARGEEVGAEKYGETGNVTPVDKMKGDGALLDDQREGAEERREVTAPLDDDRRDVFSLDEEQAKDVAHAPVHVEDKVDVEDAGVNAQEMREPGVAEVIGKDGDRGSDEHPAIESRSFDYDTQELPDQQNVEVKGGPGNEDAHNVEHGDEQQDKGTCKSEMVDREVALPQDGMQDGDERESVDMSQGSVDGAEGIGKERSDAIPLGSKEGRHGTLLDEHNEGVEDRTETTGPRDEQSRDVASFDERPFSGPPQAADQIDVQEELKNAEKVREPGPADVVEEKGVDHYKDHSPSPKLPGMELRGAQDDGAEGGVGGDEGVPKFEQKNVELKEAVEQQEERKQADGHPLEKSAAASQPGEAEGEAPLTSLQRHVDAMTPEDDERRALGKEGARGVDVHSGPAIPRRGDAEVEGEDTGKPNRDDGHEGPKAAPKPKPGGDLDVGEQSDIQTSTREFAEPSPPHDDKPKKGVFQRIKDKLTPPYHGHSH